MKPRLALVQPSHLAFRRYVAASSGPKDVVIVVDISGSMEKNDRWATSASYNRSNQIRSSSRIIVPEFHTLT